MSSFLRSLWNLYLRCTGLQLSKNSASSFFSTFVESIILVLVYFFTLRVMDVWCLPRVNPLFQQFDQILIRLKYQVYSQNPLLSVLYRLLHSDFEVLLGTLSLHLNISRHTFITSLDPSLILLETLFFPYLFRPFNSTPSSTNNSKEFVKPLWRILNN